TPTLLVAFQHSISYPFFQPILARIALVFSTHHPELLQLLLLQEVYFLTPHFRIQPFLFPEPSSEISLLPFHVFSFLFLVVVLTLVTPEQSFHQVFLFLL